MDLIELGAVLGTFFDDGAGPSHDQLTRAFMRAGLPAGDSAHDSAAATGKSNESAGSSSTPPTTTPKQA